MSGQLNCPLNFEKDKSEGILFMTRWQQLYLEDKRVLSASASICAQQAAKYFRGDNKHTILDLGCGVGRDTVILAASGLNVLGVDAAHSGLVLAKRQSQRTSHGFELAEADARRLPFPPAAFEGVYCFGLLHEFVSATAAEDVSQVISEIERLLQPDGRLVLAVLAGEPALGLPHVRMFTEQMFDEATRRFKCVDKKNYEDIGCTGKSDYPIWMGKYVKMK
jgi:ubiquinone/menaquinone biosynthesis C-methylase UbiE